MILARPGRLRILVPPDCLLTIEGEEAAAAERLLERASVDPIPADADDGFGGRLTAELYESGVLADLPTGESPRQEPQVETRRTRVIVGVTGTIEAVYAPVFLKVLREQDDLDVQVVLTAAATRFVSADGLRWSSGLPVATGLFEGATADHAALGRWADVIAVVPAAAEFICRLAAGGYSDLLSATIAMASGRVVLAPATNERMWRRRAVRHAVQALYQEGFEIVLPGAGIEISDRTSGPSFGGIGVRPPELPLLIRLLARTGPDGEEASSA